MSFLYVSTDPRMSWSLYWTSVQNGWIEFSTEIDKEPFFIYPIGLIDVRKCSEPEFREIPNLLEIVDKFNILKYKHLYIYSYDILDILPFFNKLNEEFKKWERIYTKTSPPLTHSYEFKSNKIILKTVNSTWSILPNKITLIRKGSKNLEILFSDISAVSPKFDHLQKDNILQIDYTILNQSKQELLSIEQKCVSFSQMKQILSDFYINFYIYRLNNNENTP